jgi:eukaryotic-like serine/threonine-protein kinase
MAPDTGQRFGPYEILDRVGGGGMGVVFRAWDERLHREVAIKLLYDSYQMPGTRERFLQEARAASKLSHPNICTIHDIGEQDGDPYLVMELLEGETLREKIARGALSAREIVAIAQDVTSALAAAQAKGIVHRDIKPANIFLVNLPMGGTQAKVLDFGLAKIGLSEDGGWMSRSLDMTLAGATVGTLAYMSPEQACGQELDVRSDLFSLGIVMYEMATRRVPFRGTTSALVYTQLIENDPEPVRKWNESIPKDLERLILKLLAKERRDRFESAKELSSALQKIANSMEKGRWLFGTRNQAPVPLVAATEPVARQRRPAPVTPSGGKDIERRSLPYESGDSVCIRPLKNASNGFAASEVEGSDGVTIQHADSRPARALAKGSSGVHQFEFANDPIVPQSIASADDGTPAVQHGGKPNRWKPAIIAVAAIVALAGAGSLLLRAGELKPVLLKPNDTLFLAAVQNKTGDPALDAAVMEGLALDLKQSRYLKILSFEAGEAARHIVEAGAEESTSRTLEQTIAQRLGAKAYLYGEIFAEGNHYVVRVDVLNAQSNDKLTSITETAGFRDQIPAAIDRLAQVVRSEIGERRMEISASSMPLENTATTNVDALSQYFAAEKAMADGREEDALLDYQRAVQRDSKFVLAQIKLAWLYRESLAEVASSVAAQIAADSVRRSGHARLKLLAEFCYDMNQTGEYSQALATIRRYNEQFPDDVDGLISLSRVLRAQGHYIEALLASQQANRSDPYNIDAYKETESNLLHLDRFDAALQLEAQAAQLGVIAHANSIAAAYLGGKEDALASRWTQMHSGTSLSVATLSDYGLYLDNNGQLGAGVAVWKLAADDTKHIGGLASAGASLRAQGALDNALAGNCSDATELATESLKAPLRGPRAIFHSGMAAVLCGDRNSADEAISALQSSPHNSLIAQSYVPDLRAAELLQSKRPSDALELLTQEESSSVDPLTRYLRGLANAASGHDQQAADDFRSVLDYRGAAFLSGGVVYPMAQLQLARALAVAGNQTESTAAYRKFLLSWSKSDKGQGLIAEAAARSKTEANIALMSAER